MQSNSEIIDFFKSFPATLRPKCIEQVLIFGIRSIKKKFSEQPTLKKLLELNEFEDRPKRGATPNFKGIIKKEMVQDTDRIRMITARGAKENICPDTTCLPLKVEGRRAKSIHFDCFVSKFEERSRNTPGLNESLEKDKEVIRLADEFLKNPFMRSNKNHIHLNSPGLYLDSNVFSTIDVNSPTIYADVE